MDPASEAPAIVEFGRFRVLPHRRELLADGQPMELGGRAFDVLMALIEARGALVTKDEILSRVWPGTVVEENNLQVQISALRKALGEDRNLIRTISGRGYQFTAAIRFAPEEPSPRHPGAAAAEDAAARRALTNLPEHASELIARDAELDGICQLMTQHRLVTITGAGGIGKTRVGLQTARRLLPEFADGVWLVEFASLSDATLVPLTVAAALGVKLGAAQSLSERLAAALGGKRLLVALDNCEHVIAQAAQVAEDLLHGAPGVRVLATSREPLGADGECVYRLAPLDLPPEGTRDPEEILRFGAVRLFLARARAADPRLVLDGCAAAAAGALCRRLDGIPLALELAAARTAAFGIVGLMTQLDDCMRLLTRGRRTALPRHQTLMGTLDWSFGLLAEAERVVLRRLAVFAPGFTLAAAVAAAADGRIDEAAVVNCIAALVAKSLVTVDSGDLATRYRLLETTSRLDGSTYYRLLDTTRAYAAAKLTDSGEGQAAARRHALHYTDLFQSDTIRATAFGGRDMSAYEPHLANVRAALEWGFSGAGDAAIGVELAARSAPLFLGLSLLGECERWCERAMAALPERDRGTKGELALQEALAVSSMFTRGNSDEVRAVIERGLALAEALGDHQHQLHLLAGLHIFLTRIGHHRAALAVAERSVTVTRAVGDPAGIVMAEWMLGVTHHLIGDQAAAQRHCERGLELAAACGHVHVDFFGYDHRVRALVALARALWLRGRPERALAFAHQAIDEAASRDHPVTVCISFIYTIPVFLWTGDVEGARERIERLIAQAAKYSLGPYHAVGLALKGELMIARGEAGAGVQLLRGALATLQAERHHILTRGFCRALAEGLARCGQFDDAMAAIAQAVTLADQSEETFDMPDLLRARAEIVLAGPQPDRTAAEASLVCSLEWARKQSALGWELRAAIQLARLWEQHGCADRARDMLADVCQWFTEGFETADLKTASRLLAELGHTSHDPAAHSPGT